MQHMEIAGQQQMERSIGTGGSVLLGMGSMLGTGLFVGIALATAMSGTWVLVAIAVAMLTATCNGLSSAHGHEGSGAPGNTASGKDLGD